MKDIGDTIIRKVDLGKILIIGFVFTFLLTTTITLAQTTTNFTQTINSGTLSVDITDSDYETVAEPAVTMSDTAFSFSCQIVTGTFGTSSEQVYIQNPGAASGGWTVTLAASSTEDLWTSGGGEFFDFNDPGGSGCTDSGIDGDSFGGQMTVDPSGATLSAGSCSNCNTDDINLGSQASFEEDEIDSITIVTGAPESDDIGDWYIRGIQISQKIPGEQPPANDYSIEMMLSIMTI